MLIAKRLTIDLQSLMDLRHEQLQVLFVGSRNSTVVLPGIELALQAAQAILDALHSLAKRIECTRDPRRQPRGAC